MFNSVAASRRLVLRAAVYQLAAVLLVALVFLLKGAAWATAALMGGGSLTLGTLLAAWLALGNQVAPATTALGRLLAGMIVKWCVVILTLALALVGMGLPPLPLLLGVLAATLAFVVTHSIQR